MKQTEFKELIRAGGLSRYSELYSDTAAEADRFIEAVNSYARSFGGGDISVFSVPGRSEIIGNHTDHNGGKVMAGAITRDIIAVAAPNGDGVIRYRSEGYAEDTVRLCDVTSPKRFKKFTSSALVAGMAGGFIKEGYKVGGFNVYMTTKVLRGSGLSSSAAFEVMIGNILNHLYNGGKVDNKEIAKLAQYSENVYFGKPCGLMDQMACAVGSFVYIDFADRDNPEVEPVNFSLADSGYALCIVNTGGSHASLNGDYASVPTEMKAVAAFFGKEVLREVAYGDFCQSISELRTQCGDRAVLRAMHYFAENKRVDAQKAALLKNDLNEYLRLVKLSGDSSFKFLQNVYTNRNVEEQGISLALAVTERFGSVCRVHGGGFAGTIQAYILTERVNDYKKTIESIFGENACNVYTIRPFGAAVVTENEIKG